MKIPHIDRERLPQPLQKLWSYDIFYFLSYGLFLITSILSTSFYYSYFIGRPYMWLQILCVALLVVHEFRNGGFRTQQWVGFAITAVMFLIALRVSSGNLHRLVALMMLYIYCARNIPFAKIATVTLKISIVVVCVIVFSGYLGIIDNVAASKNGRTREYLGFRYALYLPGILLNMTALWIWLRKNTITVPGALVWAVLNWLVYYKTDSRISFLLAEALLLAALVMRWIPRLLDKLQALWALMAGSFAIFGGFSLFMTIIYDSTVPWMRKLNSILESRLKLGSRSLEEHGLNLFGQKIEWIGYGLDAFGNSVDGTYTYVDCLYVKILQRYGIVFTLLLMVLLCWAMFRLWKRKEYHILLISASVAAHCVLDDLSFALHYNTLWIALGVALLNPSMLNWDGKTSQNLPPAPDKTQ